VLMTLLRRLGIRHATSALAPGSPRANGKAERVIQTLLREWACAYRALAGAASL